MGCLKWIWLHPEQICSYNPKHVVTHLLPTIMFQATDTAERCTITTISDTVKQSQMFMVDRLQDKVHLPVRMHCPATTLLTAGSL